MKPMLVSLHLGGREIGLHTYGVLIGCGCAVAIVLAFREARRQGLDGSKVLDLSFWMLVDRALVGRGCSTSRSTRAPSRGSASAAATTAGGAQPGPRRRGLHARPPGLGGRPRVLWRLHRRLRVRVLLSRAGRDGRSGRSATSTRRRWRSGTRLAGSAASPPAAVSARRATRRRTGARASAPTASRSRSCARSRPSPTAPC